MKTYLLFGIPSVAAAAAELDRLLPGPDRWVLKTPTGDPIAYFQIDAQNIDFEGPDDPNGPGPLVNVAISGRHYNEDEQVIAVLRQVQLAIGGIIRNDHDQLV